MPKPVYLDHNATSQMRPSIVHAMTASLMHCGNPSSIHAFGRSARKLVEQSREKIAQFIGADANQIIFTSGGTESNNLAIAYSARKRVLVSAIEHDSVRLVRKDAEIIPVDKDGVVRLDILTDMLAQNPEPALVSVMLANNETGVIQPISAVATICKNYGALLHTDAVQALGKMPLDFKALGVDMMTVAAHKIGGPQGVGILVFNDAVPLAAMIRGGGQERSRRAGTENVAAIVGFGALIDELQLRMASSCDKMLALREELESALMASGAGLIVAQNAARLPNTASIILDGMKSELQLMRLDMANVAVSAGSACSSGKVKPSHVLIAMGYTPEEAGCAIRVSLGWNSSREDIQEFLAAYRSLGKGAEKTISSVRAMINSFAA